MDTLETAGQRLVADPVAPPAPLGELRSRVQRRRRRRVASRAGAVLVALGLTVGSVQLMNDGDDPTLRTADEPAGETGRLGELLTLLPGAPPFGDAAATITLVDLAAIRATWGIPAPGPAAFTADGTIEPTGDDDALLEALEEESLWLGRIATAADVRAELGIDPGRFDRSARWHPYDGTLVPEDLIVAEGHIEPSTVDQVVRAAPYWGERTAAEEDGGTTLYQWGDDPLAPDAAHKTPLRPLGQGSALAVTEGWAAFALRPVTVAAAAARAGRALSLADSPNLRSLVDLADRHDAHSLSIAPVGHLATAQPQPGLIAAGTRWSMVASRSNSQGDRLSVLAIVTENRAVADAAMEALADHQPQREAELVWLVLEGDDDDVQRRFADASQALGGFWNGNTEE